MARSDPLFVPQVQSSEACNYCSFHLLGCCFDPKKMVRGYVAAPCFGCKDVEQ